MICLLVLSMMLLLTGCSHVTSEMKESRENGIALMESGDTMLFFILLIFLVFLYCLYILNFTFYFVSLYAL